MHTRPLLAIAALGVSSTLLGAAGATAGTPAHSTPGSPHRILDHNVSGEAAVRALGNDLDLVAQRYDKTPGELTHRLRTDSSLSADLTGRLHVKEPLHANPPTDVPTPEPGPFPNGNTFRLHSKPGAERTIFLDFDGGPVS